MNERMDEAKWNGAGWVAIAAAALMPPTLILSLLADTVLQGKPAGFSVGLMAAVVSTAAMLLSMIAIFRFRELLNERYGYHAIDTLITILLITLPIIALVGAMGRIVTMMLAEGQASLIVRSMFALPVIFLGVLMGIVTIIIGARLLSFTGDMENLMRPYAVLSIIAGACFALVLLAPLGMLFDIAGTILLALMFFRAAQTAPAVEFV